ncbi:TonB-dependent receptor domain-containing protein [Erythrobacter sp. YT30]|uniref:TonB-dependent receptor domain-containing protein n=1 Tax=Erythrobacter sp. YT30 TaxID=1735012 RepID=UPI00076CBD7F|nr:TonB-dependent receptor [Erythrobacter sp. YT30]KWV91095.1 hypothetical protein AUC45_07190 [Erythrobacter sp. YT30]
MQTSHLSRPVFSKALLFAAASALPFAANAQEAPSSEGTNAEEGTPIVVTGSRIARDPNIGAPSPILSVTAEELTRTGTPDLADTLRDIPALSTSTTADGSIDGVFSADIGVGQSVLNLRGLGANRTLVLVNGRRHVAGVDGQQAVDINSIPTALIERVETLTGGASSIYGADAVTGVVNFVLKDDFEGLQANVQSGISGEGDAWRINGDLTWGVNFADGRGNFVVSGEYARGDEIQFGDREFSRNNGIFDDYPNPAFNFQAGDLGADTPNFNGEGFNVGDAIPTDGFSFTPTAAEQALIDRRLGATSRFIAGDPRFAISAAGGLVAPGDFGTGPDNNGNGIPDCDESFVGRNVGGIIGGCATIVEGGGVQIYQDGLIGRLSNQFGGSGIPNNFDVNSLIPETERWSINANFSFEFSDEAELFFEGKYVSSTAEFQAQPNTFYDLLTVRSDNPFITPELQGYVTELLGPQLGFTNPGYDTQFDNGLTDGFYISRDPSDLGPNRDREEYETWRFVGGLRGAITDHFSYEFSANYGRYERRSLDRNRVITDRWFAAIDVVADPVTGQPICRSDIDPTAPTTTPFGIPVSDPGFFTFNPGDGSCRPANILGGPGAISQEAIDFITTTLDDRFTLEQFVINATFTGDTGAFLELPGGPIGFAGGFEFREEKSAAVFDPLIRGVVPVTTPQANEGDLLSDLGFPQQSLVFDPEVPALNESGEFTVYELFGELRLPILSGVPFAETLEVSGAARYSNYTSVGNTFTWNVGGLWAPTEDILFRGTYAEAVRAPNITELFAPAQGTTFRPDDPCDANELATAADPALRQRNCEAIFAELGFDPTLGTGSYAYTDPLTARFTGTLAGNPDLEEETATTWTVGTQITPRFLSGLVLSVDYYNIEIENAIDPVGSQDIVDNCVDSASIDNQFCAAVDRRPDNGGFRFLRQSVLNFARLETAGVEASIRYRFDLGEHTFTLAGSGTWVDKIDEFFDPADLTNVDPELGELQRPEWSGRGSVTWDWSRLSVTYGVTYLDSMGLRAVEIETVGTGNTFAYTPENGLSDEAFIHDISFNFEATDQFSIYGGVNNLFDRDPFVTEQAYPVSPVGRYFFLGATFNM